MAALVYKDIILKAQSNGYRVNLLFFWLNSVALARERVRLRVMEGGTAKGINLAEITELFGEEYRVHAEEQLQKVNPNHYQCNGDTVSLTDEGKFFADGIAEELFS